MARVSKWYVTLAPGTKQASQQSDPVFASTSDAALAVARAKYDRDDVAVRESMFDLGGLFDGLFGAGRA